MKYYSEKGNEIKNPDLSKGYTYEISYKTGSHTEVMAGTEGLGENGDALSKIVDDFEIRTIYHAYTDEELEAMSAPTDPTIEERVSAIEEALLAIMGE